MIEEMRVISLSPFTARNLTSRDLLLWESYGSIPRSDDGFGIVCLVLRRHPLLSCGNVHVIRGGTQILSAPNTATGHPRRERRREVLDCECPFTGGLSRVDGAFTPHGGGRLHSLDRHLIWHLFHIR